MLLLLDILTVMLNTYVSISFLFEVTDLSVCLGPSFLDLNTKQFIQNTLVWEHGLTSSWVCTFFSCRSWLSTLPSHSHSCFFRPVELSKWKSWKLSALSSNLLTSNLLTLCFFSPVTERKRRGVKEEKAITLGRHLCWQQRKKSSLVFNC